MDKKTYTIARITALIISLVIAYALWTFIRPRFIAPVSQETALTSEQKDQSTDLAQSTTLVPATETVQTVQHPVEKETPKTVQAPSDAAQKTPQPIPSPASADSKKESSSSTKTSSKTANRTVTIHNGIEKKMLGYKKFGTHYPTHFKVTIGEKALEQGESLATNIQDNTLVIRYDFEFMNGYRNGAKEVTFTLKPEAENLTLAFNWKGEHRLLVAEAEKITAIVEKDVPYQA